ncbi:MAG: ribonuclease Z [Thermoleophilia bacterium]|nr:ribonuclease Z [Thermoleophilia bacterium]
MDLDVVILGTAGSVPTPGRALSSALIRRGGERFLLDCGEGTQRQMMRAGGLADIDIVLLTHLHADHTLGLPGMLKTFALRERSVPLTIAGPVGTDSFFRQISPLIGRLPYALDIVDVDDGWQCDGDGYVLEALETDHSVRSVGWMLREHDRPGHFDTDAARALGVPYGPAFGELQRGNIVTLDDGTTIEPGQVLGEARQGRTIIYTGDTRACRRIRESAAGASVLVHEATFTVEEAARAVETGHSTAHEAAVTAAAADVGLLVLTHISNRYAGRELLDEALDVFDRTVLPRDFDVINVPFRERGDPELIAQGARPNAGRQSRQAAPAAPS